MNFIEIIGLFAAACTTSAYIPQAVKVMRTKHTKDLSLGMYILIVIGLFSWLAYGIFMKNLPLILANSITLIFASITLILKIKYK